MIEQDGAHFDALIALGNLLDRTGYRSAARLSYLEAAKVRENPIVYVNLGNTYLDTNELEPARKYFERAMDLDATQPEAHQGMSYVFARLGDEDAAEPHREIGFRDRAVTKLPYRGTGTPIQAVLLVSALGGNVATDDFLVASTFETTRIFVDYYREKTLPQADLIFNAIGDADRCGAALARAAAFTVKSPARVINRPDRVLQTSRVQISELARGIPNLVAPMTLATTKAELRDAVPFSFPFLVRAPGFHTGMHFVRIDDQDALNDALMTLPSEQLIAIEYVDARGADGGYRKYRAMFIDGKLYPLHLAISTDWKVHYFTSAMAENAGYQKEEQAFLGDMDRAIGVKATSALKEFGGRLDLDYAGIDFGLESTGDVLLFEANATMVVPSREVNPDLAYRLPHFERVIQAVRDMLRWNR